jgi:hypothetical protein
MNSHNQVSEVTDGLAELVETRVRSLANKLSLPHTLQEIEAEVVALNDLIHAFKHKDELLEKLLDGATAEGERGQIRQTLEAMNMKVTANGEELERLHDKSHQLLERSIYLIAKAQRQINKEAHKHSGYALELCRLCKGIGGSTHNPCRPCKGRGTVLVHQPAHKCQSCYGKGKASSAKAVSHAEQLCVFCRGTGWVMTANE